MKILLCSDLAGRSLPSGPEEIESSDMILLAGDITLGAKVKMLPVRLWKN